MTTKIKEQLIALNPEFELLYEYICSQIDKLKKPSDPSKRFSEKHTILITYPDQFQSSNESHLKSLNRFLNEDLEGLISHVHILPFYPWTSDDGFSPTDYKEVDPDYGTWKDIEEIPQDKMFDCIFNHISSESPLFKKALSGDKKSMAMFHLYSQDEYQEKSFQENITKVVRPRTSPLFHEYKFQDENKYVWTTFSKDQIDTNINNSDMVKYILETFFLYIEKGSTFFRIDAVPFMWKELGTNCSHLPKTHLFIKLFRSILDEINSELVLITESNVPHLENITYWGKDDEAHVIYNFSLAPLLLHALTFQTNEYINSWSENVFKTSDFTTFLNFTATHDGIGMRGLEGLVQDEDIAKLCEIAKSQGGKIGEKRSRDGSVRPYELNCTWRSFLEDDKLSEEDFLNKVVNSHALVMFYPGIAAHYAHNFFASKNWSEGFLQSGIARRLNRKKFNYPISYNSFEKNAMKKLKELIKIKSTHRCFHPNAKLEVISTKNNIIAFKRKYDQDEKLVIFNLSDQAEDQTIENQTFQLRPFELVIY